MPNKEPVDWITVNGKHIPLFEGESKKDAINRAIAKDNEDIKEKQIAKNKSEADDLSNKSNIVFDIAKAGKYEQEAKECANKIKELAKEYKSTIVSYTIVPGSLTVGGGAYMLDNKTSISVGANDLRLNSSTDGLKLGKNQIYGTTFHEFAHSLAQSRQKNPKDAAFWKELSALRREYRKESASSDWRSKKRISLYSEKDIDEFLAEGFAQAKLSDNPSPYAVKVLEIVDKYFKR